MKIEMGESLFYSWLRHVKECQIVQTNWKVSSQWSLSDADELVDNIILYRLIKRLRRCTCRCRAIKNRLYRFSGSFINNFSLYLY